MDPVKTLQVDRLNVRIYATREDMGKAAAFDVANRMRQFLANQDEIRMIFAAAPSQNEFLKYLVAEKDIEWQKVSAFHMDEYLGLEQDAPQGFGNFLKKRIFSKVPFKSIHLIQANSKHPESECTRYSGLLHQAPIDIVCMGIGENGHIAFNDPPVADFADPELVKVVTLDDVCRQQQVNDGCFFDISDVPTHAITLTVPQLISAKSLFCIVPASSKANAVARTISDRISTECPSSILRTHNDVVLYLDTDSAQKIKEL